MFGGNMQKHRSRSKKADWDGTVTDLSVYRLSNQQLAKKHQLFKSKNIEIARKEMYEKPLTTANSSVNNTKHNTIEELLYEAERSLENVKGISTSNYNESPRRYCVSPIVTVAPQVNKEETISISVMTPPKTIASSDDVTNNIITDDKTIKLHDHDMCPCNDSTQLLYKAIDELQYNNSILMETIIEQQNTIDILAQDMLLLKQQLQLHTIVSTTNTVHETTNQQSFVPLPLSQ